MKIDVSTLGMKYEVESASRHSIISGKALTGCYHFEITETNCCVLWVGRYSTEDEIRLRVDAVEQMLQAKIILPVDSSEDAVGLYHVSITKDITPVLVFRGTNSMLLIHYHPDFLKANQECDLAFQSGMSLKPNREMVEIIRQLIHQPLKDKRLQQFVQLKCEELFMHICAEAEKMNESFSPEIIEKLRTIDHAIRENLQENYSLPQLAKIGSLGVTQLQDYFTKYFGVNVHKHITAVKMRHAKEKILGSNESLRSIAIEIGFRNDTNFSEAFRKHFGFSPGSLRKKPH